MARFLPNWVSPPGNTISDVLKDRNISVTDFSTQMEMDELFINKLLIGEERITNPIAEKLVKCIGSTVGFWMRREIQYRKNLKRLAKKKS